MNSSFFMLHVRIRSILDCKGDLLILAEFFGRVFASVDSCLNFEFIVLYLEFLDDLKLGFFWSSCFSSHLLEDSADMKKLWIKL